MGGDGEVKVLSRLFTLKYHEQLSDRTLIAERLGVSPAELGKYEEKLEALLKAKIGRISPDRLEYVCPECLNARVVEDAETGERVCTSCGMVVSRGEQVSMDLPFDTTYALTSELALGRSLGGTLPSNGLYRVLAKGRNGAVDLGIRARQIRVLTEVNEHPALARMLKLAFELSKRFGLEGDKLFNNDLGANVRRTFWLLRELHLNVKVGETVETVFWLTLCQHGKTGLASSVQGKVKLNPKILNLTVKLNYFLCELEREPVHTGIIQTIMLQALGKSR
ncbi:MAG: TFIIB-type zinc ribbon-containing protein [Bacteroidota bacterium]